MSATVGTRGAVDLTGQVAVVTGAGSGIGRAMALTLAAAGAGVVVNDIVAERAAETAALITQAGGACTQAVADIADEAEVTEFTAAALAHWGRVDVLCNNAGIMDRIHLPSDTPTALWDRVMAVNITGQFLVTRALLPHMLARKYGVIINTTSIAGLRGASGGLAYTVSKHGMVGLTRSIAWTHKLDGIRCNAICPGPTDTNISNGEGLAAFDQEGLTRVLPVMNLATRSTGPQSMADLALFLASDAAAFITGAIIPVDGGWIAG